MTQTAACWHAVSELRERLPVLWVVAVQWRRTVLPLACKQECAPRRAFVHAMNRQQVKPAARHTVTFGRAKSQGVYVAGSVKRTNDGP